MSDIITVFALGNAGYGFMGGVKGAKLKLKYFEAASSEAIFWVSRSMQTRVTDYLFQEMFFLDSIT